MTDLLPIAPRHLPCKCCGGLARPYGVVDFSKSCEAVRGRTWPLTGIPIYYFRCTSCGFVFTSAFDAFTNGDFAHHIYNEAYVQVDPDYADVRPRGSAKALEGLFPGEKPPTLLDFGGGAGVLGELLRKAGFPDVDTYDPFVSAFSARPNRRYSCIVSFEVLEHTPDPVRTFMDMDELLVDDGVILFSTLLQPEDMDRQGTNWWYVAPRNGHISLYTRESLLAIVEPMGYRLGSFSDNFHVVFRTAPAFARHLLGDE